MAPFREHPHAAPWMLTFSRWAQWQRPAPVADRRGRAEGGPIRHTGACWCPLLWSVADTADEPAPPPVENAGIRSQQQCSNLRCLVQPFQETVILELPSVRALIRSPAGNIPSETALAAYFDSRATSNCRYITVTPSRHAPSHGQVTTVHHSEAALAPLHLPETATGSLPPTQGQRAHLITAGALSSNHIVGALSPSQGQRAYLIRGPI